VIDVIDPNPWTSIDKHYKPAILPQRSISEKMVSHSFLAPLLLLGNSTTANPTGATTRIILY
jgi:hypothetical protein